MKRAEVFHTFLPVYNERSRVLILGTLPSPKSRELGFYYGHPLNRFWRVLALVFEQPVPETVGEKRSFLLENRVALWDVLASCEIMGASDGTIRNPVPNDIAGLLAGSGIRAVFANGRAAAGLYRKLCREKTGIDCIPLPSTSPANCACSFERLVEAYRGIIAYQ